MINLTKLFLIILLSFFLLKCTTLKKRQNNNVYAYKFLDISTYPYSINEKMFWENDMELAKLRLNISFKDLLKNIEKMKRIKKQFSADFDYAFIIKEKQKTDTIYASLIRNLWLIKKNGEFKVYKDNKGELKSILVNYSSFFSDCW